MNKPSLRTRVGSLTSRGMWILSGLCLVGSVLLIYLAERSESIARTIAGLFGFLGVVATIIIAFIAIALTLITKGSRKIDEVLSQRQSTTPRRGVVLDETDYQNK